MKYILISPLRVQSGDWERFSRYITKLFDGAETKQSIVQALGAKWEYHGNQNYKYHSLEPSVSVAGDIFVEPLKAALAAAFRRVRRNAFALQALNDGALLVLFNTGEACVIEVHDAPDDLEECVKSLVTERDAANALIAQAAQALAKIANKAGASFEGSETMTHSLLVASAQEPLLQEMAERCFKAEGLDYSPDKDHAVQFTPGWSFSVCISPSPNDFWDAVAVMVRAQTEWYSVRIARNFCLRTLSETDLTSNLNALLELERLVIGYQTEFRLWRHRMQEYRANLKPSLTHQAEKIEQMWKTSEAKDYVNETLAQTRNLIQSSYSRRLLLQERRQSLMIFLLTSLGVLSMASIAATYWDWLTAADLFQDTDVASAKGVTFVKTMLWSLSGLTVALIAWFFWSRTSRD